MLLEVYFAKQNNTMTASTVLLYIFTKLKSKFNLFVLDSDMNELEHKWTDREKTPAIHQLLTVIRNNNRIASSYEDNLVDNVSDFAINASPSKTGLIVAGTEYDTIIKANKRLNLIGFDITTAESILDREKLCPFVGSTWTGKIENFIKANC
jgi:hypothetical protein